MSYSCFLNIRSTSTHIHISYFRSIKLHFLPYPFRCYWWFSWNLFRYGTKTVAVEGIVGKEEDMLLLPIFESLTASPSSPPLPRCNCGPPDWFSLRILFCLLVSFSPLVCFAKTAVRLRSLLSRCFNPIALACLSRRARSCLLSCSPLSALIREVAIAVSGVIPFAGWVSIPESGESGCSWGRGLLVGRDEDWWLDSSTWGAVAVNGESSDAPLRSVFEDAKSFGRSSRLLSTAAGECDSGQKLLSKGCLCPGHDKRRNAEGRRWRSSRSMT